MILAQPYLTICKETSVVSFKSTVQKWLTHQFIQLLLSYKLRVLGITRPNRIIINKLIFHSSIRCDYSFVLFHRNTILDIGVIFFPVEVQNNSQLCHTCLQQRCTYSRTFPQRTPIICFFFSSPSVPMKTCHGKRGCALAEPGGPWCLTFALRQLENLRFFIQITCWAP